MKKKKRNLLLGLIRKNKTNNHLKFEFHFVFYEIIQLINHISYLSICRFSLLIE